MSLGLALGLGAMILVLALIATCIREAARTNSCFWGHEKKYVAIRDLRSCGHYINWTWNHSHLQDARWVCERCSAMGEERLDSPGIWMVEHGKIVRDEKRWTSWKDQANIR